jgi:hypothetical protein
MIVDQAPIMKTYKQGEKYFLVGHSVSTPVMYKPCDKFGNGKLVKTLRERKHEDVHLIGSFLNFYVSIHVNFLHVSPG